MSLKPKDKAKGRKVAVEEFEDMMGTEITTSIRYGSLCLRKENVNISYSASGEIKITGAYGM